MRTFRSVKNRKGSVLPLVALMLFVLLGFTALAVDAGSLYLDRREMALAADAGALAGAKELADSNGINDVKAEEIAVKVSEINGADIGEVVAEVKDVSGREVIEVTVNKTKSSFFARIFGIDNTTVVARSVATWGYPKSITSGDILPLFVLEDYYNSNEIVVLHAFKDISESNYGTLRLGGSGGGASDLKDYLGRDKYFTGTLTTETLLSGEPGGNQSLSQGIESRMDKANLIPGINELDKLARKRIMTGIVPVVNYDKLYKNADGKLNGFLEKLIPVEYFAVFEIYDVVDNKEKGSSKQLYKTPNYLSDGSKENYKGKDYDDGAVLGKFTGGTFDIVVNVVPGDQTPPGDDSIAVKYFKLIDADYIGD